MDKGSANFHQEFLLNFYQEFLPNFYQELVSKYFWLTGHVVSVTAAQLCHCGMKPATDSV